MNAVFAYFHTLSIIALGALLFAQLLTFDLLENKLGFQRFWMLSLGVVTAAAVALISGIALLIWTDRGGAFYLHNPVFYIKLAIFVAMWLVAVTPARIIMQWRQQEAVSGNLTDAGLVPLVERYVVFELILLLVIPLAASLAARGIGTQLSAS